MWHGRYNYTQQTILNFVDLIIASYLFCLFIKTVNYFSISYFLNLTFKKWLNYKKLNVLVKFPPQSLHFAISVLGVVTAGTGINRESKHKECCYAGRVNHSEARRLYQRQMYLVGNGTSPADRPSIENWLYCTCPRQLRLLLLLLLGDVTVAVAILRLWRTWLYDVERVFVSTWHTAPMSSCVDADQLKRISFDATHTHTHTHTHTLPR